MEGRGQPPPQQQQDDVEMEVKAEVVRVRGDKRKRDPDDVGLKAEGADKAKQEGRPVPAVPVTEGGNPPTKKPAHPLYVLRNMPKDDTKESCKIRFYIYTNLLTELMDSASVAKLLNTLLPALGITDIEHFTFELFLQSSMDNTFRLLGSIGVFGKIVEGILTRAGMTKEDLTHPKFEGAELFDAVVGAMKDLYNTYMLFGKGSLFKILGSNA